MKSTKFSLNVSDGVKAFIMAVGIPILTVVQQLLPSWTDWLTLHTSSSVALIVQATIAGIITYLSKNFFTNDNVPAVKTLAKQDVTIIDNKTGQPVTPETVKNQQTKI